VDLLFQIGDNILYPMHGAGIVEAIEEKEILGEKQEYYIIKMPIGDMQILVPMGKEEHLGIRLTVDMDTLEKALLVFHNEDADSKLPWNQRNRINMDKMKTGDIHDGAEVVRDLKGRSKVKVLNTSERRMLDSAWKILVSELALVKGFTEVQATDLLNKEVNHVG
jgi:CarD family transcriptional regulator